HCSLPRRPGGRLRVSLLLVLAGRSLPGREHRFRARPRLVHEGHGGKAADDRIDSSKIAHLLRGGNLPIAYAYPKGLRETRTAIETIAQLSSDFVAVKPRQRTE